MTEKVVLITGCSSGIGRSLAQAAAARGLTVYATARRPQVLADIEGERIHGLALDVGDPSSIAAAIDAVRTRGGRLDFVINNAGQSLFGPLAELPLEKFEALLATNVTGQLAVCQAAVGLMAAQGSGCIVNIGSVMGVVTTPFAAAYSASKAALHLLSDGLRMELAPFGIHVVLVKPAAVQSQIADNAVSYSDLDRYATEGSLYRDIHRFILARARASQDRPMGSDAFAERIWDQLLRPSPPAEIRAGNGTAMFRMLERLPRAWRDGLFSRRFGLTRLPANPDSRK